MSEPLSGRASEHVSDEQLSLLVDGRLSLASREAVVDHIRRCLACAARHDALIELTATLRLQRPLEWTPAQTATTLQRLHAHGKSRLLRARRPRRRDWSLPFSLLLALAGGLALAALAGGSHLFVLPAGTAALVEAGPLAAGRWLVALAAAVLIGLLAVPLSRSR